MMGFNTGSHSWISFTSDQTSAYNTFGTFKTGYGNGTGGVQIDTELNKGYKGTDSITVWIDDEHEKLLKDFIEMKKKVGEKAWSNADNCTDFATDAFGVGSGTFLDPANGKTSKWPSNLANEIQGVNKATQAADRAVSKPVNGNINHGGLLQK
jgi:hypothetical protein